jgi:hypothetical protein
MDVDDRQVAVVSYISVFQLEFERFGMSDSEPVINKNKAHRKDKREYKAVHLLLLLIIFKAWDTDDIDQ